MFILRRPGLLEESAVLEAEAGLLADQADMALAIERDPEGTVEVVNVYGRTVWPVGLAREIMWLEDRAMAKYRKAWGW